MPNQRVGTDVPPAQGVVRDASCGHLGFDVALEVFPGAKGGRQVRAWHEAEDLRARRNETGILRLPERGVRRERDEERDVSGERRDRLDRPLLVRDRDVHVQTVDRLHPRGPAQLPVHLSVALFPVICCAVAFEKGWAPAAASRAPQPSTRSPSLRRREGSSAASSATVP